MLDFKKTHPGKIAVVPLNVPMEKRCNPNIKHTQAMFKDACTYAEYAMAVCAADREKFPAYHDWLMKGGFPPSVKKAREKAEELVGREAFEKALTHPSVQEWIESGIAVHQFLKAKSIPKLIVKNTVISSSGVSSKKLFRSLEEALGLESKD